ncbi:MAG TPA: DNA adenine methylase [Desulfobacterales bacterium]|nr:DNA adenine methylase [Desulfobacterales bacterium]
MKDAPTRPAMRYHGGKWRIAPWIISHFPKHKTYVEPYGGAASVLLRKRRSSGEVYNDLDGDVVNLFRVLRSPLQREQLIESIRYTPYARSEFQVAFEPADDAGNIERARRLLVRAEMGFGSAGATRGKTGFRCQTHAHLDRDPPGRSVQMVWADKVNVLKKVATRFQGVMIENRPAMEVISYWDHQEKTLFYIDPPYLPGVRDSHTHRAYRHEMSDDQHVELLKELCALRGMVVISGYQSDIYNSLLSGWHTEGRSVSAAGNRGSVVRVERLWMNQAVVDQLNKKGPLFDG